MATIEIILGQKFIEKAAKRSGKKVDVKQSALNCAELLKEELAKLTDDTVEINLSWFGTDFVRTLYDDTDDQQVKRIVKKVINKPQVWSVRR